MISTHWIVADSLAGFEGTNFEAKSYNVPHDMQGSQIKTWLNGFVILAGTMKLDSIDLPSYELQLIHLTGINM